MEKIFDSMHGSCKEFAMYVRTTEGVGSGQKSLEIQEGGGDASRLYGFYNKPELQKALSLLKLDISYTRANGNFIYYLKEGYEVPVLDLLGGYGSTILGHNHHEIKSLIHQFLDSDGVIHGQGSIRTSSAFLAEQLNTHLRSRYITTLVNSGTEAIEAAIKHAHIEWQEKKRRALVNIERLRNLHLATLPKGREKIVAIDETIEKIKSAEPIFVALEGAFHGKTAGALSVTFNSNYSGMYPSRPIKSRFLKRESSLDEIQSLFEEHSVKLGLGNGLSQDQGADGARFSSIIGVCVELIQGEGGIRPLNHEFVSNLATTCRKNSVPLIVDEIQTGVYRTGKFLASEWYDLQPDYIALGKSLGGGVAKIGALLVQESSYQNDFGMLHSSTFAEDDLSSSIALKTLELLAREGDLCTRAHAFEKRIRESAEKLSARFPGVIREVRGRGWLVGIEFNLANSESEPFFLELIRDSGMITWLCASYLLHRHGVRVAVTLSQPQTIRIEPSASVSEGETTQFLDGLSSLVQKIYERRWLDITSHLWTNEKELKGSTFASVPKAARLKPTDSARKVVFLSHLIDLDNFQNLDPFLGKLQKADAQRLLENIDRWSEGSCCHQQEITGTGGQSIFFELYGIAASTVFFEKSLRQGDLRAFEKVRNATLAMERQRVSYLGLGQYTSIVSDNGTLLTRLLPSSGMKLTTGNSFTVGLAYRALLSLLEKRKQKLSELRVGVVGVAGNICNVYAQILGDEAGELTLLHREPFQKSAKFQAAVKMVLDHSKARQENIQVANDLSALRNCDVVVMGTNTSQQILMPDHLKQGALVLDISVPSNIHPSVFSDRPDVECFQGGYAKLPKEQKFQSSLLPCPDGQVFACMAETMMVGLSGFPEHFSLGSLTKARVWESLEMADEIGFHLGSIKKLRLM